MFGAGLRAGTTRALSAARAAMGPATRAHAATIECATHGRAKGALAPAGRAPIVCRRRRRPSPLVAAPRRWSVRGRVPSSSRPQTRRRGATAEPRACRRRAGRARTTTWRTPWSWCVARRMRGCAWPLRRAALARRTLAHPGAPWRTLAHPGAPCSAAARPPSPPSPRPCPPRRAQAGAPPPRLTGPAPCAPPPGAAAIRRRARRRRRECAAAQPAGQCRGRARALAGAGRRGEGRDKRHVGGGRDGFDGGCGAPPQGSVQRVCGARAMGAQRHCWRAPRRRRAGRGAGGAPPCTPGDRAWRMPARPAGRDEPL